MNDENIIGREYFNEICKRIAPEVMSSIIKSEGVANQITVALLTELNLNISRLNMLMMRAMDISEDNVSKEEPKKVTCPYCKTLVLPDSLGYCPECKGDLAKMAALERLHLGNVEQGD